MADFSKFRSSLNGFNRADVAGYIESLCAGHAKALQAEQKQTEALSLRLTQAEDALAAQTARAEALEKELDATRTALQSTEAALDEAMVMLTEAAPEEEAEPAADYASMELEAYRRAEAMERTAAERAAHLQQQLGELLDHVGSRYEEAGQEIQVLTEDIRTNLKRLDETLSDLDVIFDETQHTFSELDSAAYTPAQ